MRRSFLVVGAILVLAPTAFVELVLVDGAHHSQSLRADTWRLVERWLDEVLSAPNHI